MKLLLKASQTATYGDIVDLKEAVQAGFILNKESLEVLSFIAKKEEHHEITTLLQIIHSCLDENLEQLSNITISDEHKRFLANIAVKQGNIKLLELMRNSGIDIKALEETESLLYTASISQQMSCVQYLLELRQEDGSPTINPDRTDDSGSTLATFAIFHNNTKLLKLLINSGTDLTIKNITENSPALLASKMGNPSVLKLIQQVNPQLITTPPQITTLNPFPYSKKITLYRNQGALLPTIIPLIKYSYVSYIKYIGEEGIDAGGLMRTFFDDLLTSDELKEYFNTILTTEDGEITTFKQLSPPYVVSPEDSIKLEEFFKLLDFTYRSLKYLAERQGNSDSSPRVPIPFTEDFCTKLASYSSMLTLYPDFTTKLTELSWEDLQKIYITLTFGTETKTREEVTQVYSFSEKDEEYQQELIEEISLLINQHQLLLKAIPLFKHSSTGKSSHFDEERPKTTAEIKQELVSSFIPPPKSLLINKNGKKTTKAIVFSGEFPLKFKKGICKYLIDNKDDDEKLSSLIKLITGGKLLSHGGQLKFTKLTNSPSLISIHTCFNRVDLNLNAIRNLALEQLNDKKNRSTFNVNQRRF